MKKIIDKIKKNICNWAATFLGLVVAVVTAWQVIDWDNFDMKKDWIKLLISTVIAFGGYVSQIRTVKKKV